MPKERKQRARKDPDAPKKPMGAYMWFSKVKREEVKIKHPNKKVTDIGRILGEMWRNLTDDEKKEFQLMAEDDKKRYEKDIEEYTTGKKPKEQQPEEQPPEQELEEEVKKPEQEETE
eukprot:TRINITY_DN2588_c0_g1_i1.p4 TRINITY_DN2588_c0_g1~~TRINITY_DN2588_c0_g1_i1.p4  ORF type:complete len:117 (-),score=33.11 TRINITY_DN2588_c0_g1_i1:238-588(-)